MAKYRVKSWLQPRRDRPNSILLFSLIVLSILYYLLPAVGIVRLVTTLLESTAVQNHPILTVIAVLVPTVLTIMLVRDDSIGREVRPLLRRFGPVALAVPFFVFYVIPYAIVPISVFVARFGLTVQYVALVVIISFLGAYFAFWLRGAKRKAYGQLEVLFGVVAILYSAAQNDITHLGVPFFGGLYIVVRGISNIEDSMSELEKPLTFKRFMQIMTYDFWLAWVVEEDYD
jgi:hypothetical protein